MQDYIPAPDDKFDQWANELITYLTTDPAAPVLSADASKALTGALGVGRLPTAMSVVSMLIMVVTQAISSILALREKNLLDALKALFVDKEEHMRKGTPTGKNKTGQISSSRKCFVCARWLVTALGVFIVLSASAQAQTPVFNEDFVSTDESGYSRINAVRCGE